MKIPGGKHKRIGPMLYITDSADPLDEGYARKIQELAATLGPGAHAVSIAHDDWCPKLKGGPCRCEPDVKSEPIE